MMIIKIVDPFDPYYSKRTVNRVNNLQKNQF